MLEIALRISTKMGENLTMRKSLMFVVVGLLVLASVPFVNAAPNNQFAGCADELGEQYGARFTVKQVNGFNMVITAVGVDGFDPAITILDQNGEVVACNNDSADATEVAFNLPGATAEASELSARADVRIPGDQGRFDYTVIVTSNTETSGEFVLMYSGAEVFGSTNIDSFEFITNEAQAEAEVPLGIIAANLKRPELAIDLELSFTYGSTTQICQDSSSTSLCEGDSEDLTGYTVTLTADDGPIALNGDDAFLRYVLGGQADTYEIQVGSDNKASFGAYVLLLHSAVAYPEAE